VVFDSVMLQDAEIRFAVLGTVRSALKTHRVVPFYQPEVEVGTGQIVGFEALARIVREDGRSSCRRSFSPRWRIIRKWAAPLALR
jgi:EAL domain-containing protein (putative c-di-GMP-specific phosphodiesterase class I)